MATKKDAASYRAARVIAHGAHEAAARVRDIVIPSETSWESLKIVKDGLSVAPGSIEDVHYSKPTQAQRNYNIDMRVIDCTCDRREKKRYKLYSLLDHEG